MLAAASGPFVRGGVRRRCACCSRASAASRSTSRTRARCTSSRCRAPAASRCCSAAAAVARLRRRGALAAARARARPRRGLVPRRSARPADRGAACARTSRRGAARLVRAEPDASASSWRCSSLAVAWITNLYNFMDGSDGLAGGMALDRLRRLRRGGVAGAATPRSPRCASRSPRRRLAFLLHNFHPARIFLGDVGSIPLGFLAAALGIVGWRDDLWPLWFPVLVFGPFIADATLTLVRRVLRARARLAGAPRPLLPAHGAHGARPPRHGVDRLCASMLLCAARGACSGAARRRRCRRRCSSATSALLGAMAIWVDVRWARFSRAQEAGMKLRRLDRLRCTTCSPPALAWIAAFWLRFNFDMPADYEELMLDSLPWVLGIHAAVFWVLGLYRGLVALRQPARPAAHRHRGRHRGARGSRGLRAPARSGTSVPRTVYVLTPVLLGARHGRQPARLSRLARGPPAADPHQAAGDAGPGARRGRWRRPALLRDLAASPQWRVVGMLDDDASKHGA